MSSLRELWRCTLSLWHSLSVPTLPTPLIESHLRSSLYFNLLTFQGVTEDLLTSGLHQNSPEPFPCLHGSSYSFQIQHRVCITNDKRKWSGLWGLVCLGIFTMSFTSDVFGGFTKLFISVFALKIWNFSAPGRISNQMLWVQETTFFLWIILYYCAHLSFWKLK